MQRTRVTLLMADGTELDGVLTTVADEMLYASTRRRQKWEGPQEDPVTFKNFLGYAVARRLGAFTGSFDEFVAQAEAVDLAESEPVDPTTPAASPVSS